MKVIQTCFYNQESINLQLYALNVEPAKHEHVYTSHGRVKNFGTWAWGLVGAHVHLDRPSSIVTQCYLSLEHPYSKHVRKSNALLLSYSSSGTGATIQ